MDVNICNINLTGTENSITHSTGALWILQLYEIVKASQILSSNIILCFWDVNTTCLGALLEAHFYFLALNANCYSWSRFDRGQKSLAKLQHKVLLWESVSEIILTPRILAKMKRKMYKIWSIQVMLYD